MNQDRQAPETENEAFDVASLPNTTEALAASQTANIAPRILDDSNQSEGLPGDQMRKAQRAGLTDQQIDEMGKSVTS